MISAFVGSIGWFVNARSSQRLLRKQHTYQIIGNYIKDEDFSRAATRIGKINILQQRPVDVQSIGEDDLRMIYKFLNHFEFLAASVWTGDLDEDLVKRIEFSRITKLYTALDPLIKQTREQFDQPRLWGEFENLAHRWMAEKHRSLDIYFVEWLALKPKRSRR